MSEPIRWGILGTGFIANQFAEGLQALPDAELRAVASRSQGRANAFGEQYNVPQRYASYAELAQASDVDAVYVATPHSSHKENTLLCLHNGKHVLCEKPFALNAAQAREMVALAREKALFLMDAVWTRFFPAMGKVRDWLAEKAIGDVLLVQSDFGFRMPEVDPTHRLFDPALGGGALLDVGIYPVQLASMVYGKEPQNIASRATLGSTGVDELSVTVLQYSDYEMATVTTALQVDTPHEARILGSRGMILIPDWWHPTQLTLRIAGETPQTFNFPIEGNGYNYEAAEVGRCLRAGRTESPIMPLDETLIIMETLDRIREQWGLRYPDED